MVLLNTTVGSVIHSAKIPLVFPFLEAGSYNSCGSEFAEDGRFHVVPACWSTFIESAGHMQREKFYTSPNYVMAIY